MAISVVPRSASVTITEPIPKLPFVAASGMRFMDTELYAVCQCQITGLPTDKPRGWTLGTIQLLWVTTNWAYYRGQNNGDGDCFLQYARPPARPEQECRDTYSSGSIFVETMPQFGIFQFVAQNFYRFPIIMTASFKDQPVITHPLTRFNSLTSKTNFLREVQIEWHFCTVFSLRNPEPLRGSDAGGVAGTYTHLKHFFWNQHWHVQCEPTDYANLTKLWTITPMGGGSWEKVPESVTSSTAAPPIRSSPTLSPPEGRQTAWFWVRRPFKPRTYKRAPYGKTMTSGAS